MLLQGKHFKNFSTCVNAQWTCRPATPGEMIEYPRTTDLKAMCSATENKEFTTCEPVEPVTCKVKIELLITCDIALTILL